MIYTLPFRFTTVSAAVVLFIFCGYIACAQTHEIKQEHMDALGWFGGDDRPNSRRNVAVGQRLRVDRGMIINSFSFHYGANFDFAQNPTGNGNEVTLRLHLRDAAGAILASKDAIVPASFSGGWVTWDGFAIPVAQDAIVNATAYLVGGYETNPYTSSYSASTTDPYTDGSAIIKEGMTDAELDAWGDWSDHSWDAAFRLSGSTIATGIDTSSPVGVPGTQLFQNYPNPMRERTTFEFVLRQASAVQLAVYDMLGKRLVMVLDAVKEQGMHRMEWSNASLPTGMYRIVLRAGAESATRVMTVLRWAAHP